MRYDAAIIGAGAEGLACAAILGRAGSHVLVVERGARAGGRCITREFYPGHRASPFVDDLGAIPATLYRELDLARHGAVFEAYASSLALWSDRHHWHPFDPHDDSGVARLLRKAAGLRRAVIDGAVARARDAKMGQRFAESDHEAWSTLPLTEALTGFVAAPDAIGHLAAEALQGRVVDPQLGGSALHLLAVGASGGKLAGGLERLSDALMAVAGETGVEFSFGLEASDIRLRDGRVVGVGLADGSEIATRSVVSTLDLKRTFLTFFPWHTLPKSVARPVSAFRLAGGTARVLFALARPPTFAVEDANQGPIHVAPNPARMSEAYQAWRAGIVADWLPIALNTVSSGDPSLAPDGAATVTATLGAIPFRLFDGGWTHEKRELLFRRALQAAESVSPGFGNRVVGHEVVTPTDIEEALGASEGDLAGGEIAGDQFFWPAPWDYPALPRTPIEGLYLAGSHLAAGAFATCVAGAAAAWAVRADQERVRPK